MDKIMSARIDEIVIQRIGMLAKRLNMTKKAVIENAVQYYATKVEFEQQVDLFEHTCGSWKRRETAASIVQDIKQKMRRSQERYKR